MRYRSVTEMAKKWNVSGYSIRKRPGLFLNKSGRPRERVRPSMA